MLTTNVFNKNTKAISEGNTLIVNQGGTGCFAENQLIVTSNGVKKIVDIDTNELVLSYNEITKQNEFRPVIEKFKYKNSEKTYRIKLKNGYYIEVTENHKFFYEGVWINLKDLLYLWKLKI